MDKSGFFKVSDMYTVADVWGWTWEKELKCRKPEKWSQEWEVDLAIKIMQKASFIHFFKRMGVFHSV